MIGNKKRIVVLLGPPGAGKGTQAELIVEKFSIPHISTGDILRGAIQEGTPLGKEAHAYMTKGELVPDELVIRLIEDRVQKPDCSDGALFDGFPRNEAQAEMFFTMKYISENSRIIAILIDLPDEEVIQRLSNRRYCPNCKSIFNLVFKVPKKKVGETYFCDNCGSKLIIRDDDKVETIKNRLNVYHSAAGPLIQYFKRKNILHVVDGSIGKKRVSEEIFDILK